MPHRRMYEHFLPKLTNLTGSRPPGPAPVRLWRTVLVRARARAPYWSVTHSDSAHPPSCEELTLLPIPGPRCTCCPGLELQRKEAEHRRGLGKAKQRVQQKPIRKLGLKETTFAVDQECPTVATWKACGLPEFPSHRGYLGNSVT